MKQVIFVPGLGDDKTIARQKRQVDRWSNKKLTSFTFDPKWESDESAETKIKRLVEFIDQNIDDELEVYGASAGGALSMTLMHEMPARITRMVLVCPKLQGSGAIGPSFQQRAPALLHTVIHSEEVIAHLHQDERTKITTYRPLFDGVVPIHDMCVAGANNKTLPLVGHVFTIAKSIVFVLPRIARR